MSRMEGVWHGAEFRDRYLELMATRFPAEAVARKRRAWDWLFANPHSTPDAPTRVYAVEKDGRPVGAFIRMPCRYALDGQETPAMHPIATVVHPDHAGAGRLMIKEQVFIRDNLSIGMPNSLRLSKIYARFEAIMGPERTLRRRVYRPGAVLAQRRRAPAAAGAALDLAARPVVRATGLRRARLRAGEEIAELSGFGAEFDAAWAAAVPDVALAQARGAAFLTWRYRDMPLERYACLALRRDGRLGGYVVTTLHEAAGARVGRITDIFAYGGGSRDYALLLAAADDRLRRAGCAYSEISFGPVPEIEAAARRTGFLLRKPILPLVMRHGDSELNAKLPQLAHRLHFCRGDHDEDY
ncbi:GNAT family protein [Roseivivax sp. CAU 1761]